MITGLSGSGKSSLAFDTIYAEGQRRYVETLSPYARQFLDQMERPEVDSIDGLSPAISIEQKTTNRSPRSTVGTITEIYDYLRVLYSSIGVPHCPICGIEISRQTTEQILQQIMALKHGRARHDSGARSCAGAKANTRRIWRNSRGRDSCARVSTAFCGRSTKRSRSTGARITPSKLWSTGCWCKPGIEKRLEASIETATKLAGRTGAGRGGEWRRTAVFAETGLPGMRRQRAATRAAVVLVQQPFRRVRNVPWAGQQAGRSIRLRLSSILPSRCSMAAWVRAAVRLT